MTNQEREAVFNRCLNWVQNQNNQDNQENHAGKLALGLPLCYAAARNHGGSLMAISRYKVGSMFIFSMPDRAPTYSQTARQRESFFYDDNGFDPVLLALSDAAPLEAFSVRNRY